MSTVFESLVKWITSSIDPKWRARIYSDDGEDVTPTITLNSLLADSDVLFCVDDWIRHNKLYMLGRSSHDFNVFATTGIYETKILLGRRYGGCSIYIHKKLNSSV